MISITTPYKDKDMRRRLGGGSNTVVQSRCFRFCFRWVTTEASFSSSSQGGRGPALAYSRLVEEGKIREDLHQRRVVAILDRLSLELEGYSPRDRRVANGVGEALSSSASISMSLWGMLSGKKGDSSAGSVSGVNVNAKGSSSSSPRGIYMFGGVGCGKSFLLDLFLESCSVAPPEKQRVHFLDWMRFVHQRLHFRRKEGLSGEKLMGAVVEDILSRGWLLCFDEFQVTDVADAMVIRSLFHSMWSKGLVMVATSNRPPRHLYHNGLQRDQFLPFIDELEEYSHLVSLEESTTDYRLLQETAAIQATDTYFYPIDGAQESQFEALWEKLTNRTRSARVTLSVMGRRLEVPRAVLGNRLARFTFHELCGRPLGADDYTALAESFHTIFLEGLPTLNIHHLEPLRRFILLIDTLYDRGVKLIVIAETQPSKLLPAVTTTLRDSDLRGPPSNAPDEIFAFNRTVSRLMEMRGARYLSRPWKPKTAHEDGKALLVQFEGRIVDEEMMESLWYHYDVNKDGHLDKSELLSLMEDVMDIRAGHRNVPDRLLELTFRKMDPEETGRINKAAFVEFGSSLNKNQWWGSGESRVEKSKPSTPKSVPLS